MTAATTQPTFSSLHDVFGPDVGSEESLVPVFGEPTVSVKHLELSDELVRMLYFHLMCGNDCGLWLFGPTGCGKTFVSQQFYGRLGMRIVRVNAKDVEFEELTGKRDIIGGNTVFTQSAMVDIFENGGLLILDEVANMDVDLLEPFFPLLEGDDLTLLRDNGRVVKRHPFFRIVGTANTNGNNSDLKNYLGAKRQSKAFLDRWSYHGMKSMSEAAEVRSVMMQMDLPEETTDLVESIVKVAHRVRAASKLEVPNGTLNFTLSSRVVFRWVKYATVFRTLDGHIKLSLGAAFSNGLDPDDKSVLDELASTVMTRAVYEGASS